MKTQSVDLLTAENDGSDLRLDIALRRAMKMSDIKIFALKPDAKANLPHRLVIDIPSTGSALPAASSSAVKGSAEKASSKSAKYSASKDEKKILKGKVICIDPGHGGTDVGAIGTLGKAKNPITKKTSPCPSPSRSATCSARREPKSS